MSYTRIIASASGIVPLLFLLSPVAYAAITVGGSGEASVGAGEEGGYLKVEDGATVTPVEGVRMENGVNTAGGIRAGGGAANIGAESETGSNPEHATGTVRAEERASANAEGGLENAEFHIDQGSETGANGTLIHSARDVRSEADLKALVSAKAKDDEHLRSVDVKHGTVEVDYDEPAALFGLFDSSVTAHISADANGDVSVAYPWYHIFMKEKYPSASLQSEIALAIAAERKAQRAGVATSTIEANVEAAFGVPDLFETIADTLKSISLSANAQASGKAYL